jgi:predicted  nucleic acid-binding Zn-ribbon protein
MDSNSLLISEIKLKVLKLLNQNKKLTTSNMELQNELDELRKQLENKKNKIEQLEDYNKIIKLASEIQLSNSEKKQLKSELTDKIKLIDDCIKMLGE